MTPKEMAKEKAKELLQKFQELGVAGNYTHPGEKLASLICVDEILSIIPMRIGVINSKWLFWNDVKREIENYGKG